VGGQRHNPPALTTAATSGSHRVGGWVGVLFELAKVIFIKITLARSNNKLPDDGD
jgi:hypothetical protein